MQLSSELNTLICQNEIIGEYNHIHDFYSIYTKSERDVIIWLPPSYNESIKSYPVLYIHDGQNVFNPNTAFTGYDWKVDETASYLIRHNYIHEMIVVGVYNTKDRLDEYNLFSAKGKDYANFLIKELKPYVDETYRSLPGKEFTTTIGSSMGGLCSFQLAMMYPKIFGNACCMSGSFWVEDHAIFEFMQTQDFSIESKIYLDCGLNEKQLINDSLKMCEVLKEIGYNSDNFYCHIDKNGSHNEKDWAQRLYIPLTFIYGKNGKARELLYPESGIKAAS